MRFAVIITLKKDVLDPQGKVVQNTLINMGMNNLKSIRQGKHFEIEVDAELMPRWLLITLAHELVHVKQYAKQQLKQLVKSSEYNYNGVRYDPTDRKRFPCSSFLPWEIEARGLEEALFLKWANAQPVDYEWAHCQVFAAAK